MLNVSCDSDSATEFPTGNVSSASTIDTDISTMNPESLVSSADPAASPAIPNTTSTATSTTEVTNTPTKTSTSTSTAAAAVSSDDEAPEETTTTQPVPALTRKQRRSKSKNAARKQKQARGKKEKAIQETEEDERTHGLGRPKAADGMCVVCAVEKGKYKCPRCRLMTCSLSCSKSHKENHPADPPSKPKPAPVNVFNPSATSTTPSDPLHPFSFLDDSDMLKALFARYPCLPDVLMRISDATQPPATGGNPLAAYGMPETKKLEKKLWDKSVGEQHGKAALRKARAREDEEGEAVRAYSELILHLMEVKGREVREVRKRKMREEGALYSQLARAGGKKARY